MANKFNDSVDIPPKDNNGSKFNINKIRIQGTITNTLGQGDDAKNSLIYLTLKWSFLTGMILTALIVLNHWFFRINEKVPDFINDVKIAWGIIVPLITLALGYAFGKAHK